MGKVRLDKKLLLRADAEGLVGVDFYSFGCRFLLLRADAEGLIRSAEVWHEEKN